MSVLMVPALVACTQGTKPPAESSPTPTTPTASFTSTTDDGRPPAQAPYLISGPAGVVRVDGAAQTTLVGLPASWAVDDRLGGIVFDYAQDLDSVRNWGVYWLPAGEDRPVYLAPDHPWQHIVDVAVLDGRPTYLHVGSDDRRYLEDFADRVFAFDLLSGARHVIGHVLEGPDAGYYLVSGGGKLLAKVKWVWSWDSALVLESLDGKTAALPVPQHLDDCYPCEIDTRLSDDGEFLAVAMRSDPTADTDDSPADPRENLDDSLSVEVFTVDLSTGDRLFSQEFLPGTRLVDFDGRHLLLDIATNEEHPAAGLVRTLIDTAGAESPSLLPPTARLIHPPVTPPPGVSRMTPFWTAVLESHDTTVLTPGDAEESVRDFADRGVAASVLLSDNYPTLNPGWWVVYSGTFATEGEAIEHCEAIETTGASCYPRYVATARSIPSPHVEELDVLTALGSYLPNVLGTPTPGQWFCAPHLFGFEEHGGEVTAWAWADCASHGTDGVEVTEFARLSVPLKADLLQTEDLRVVGHETLTPGESVSDAVQRLFPNNLRSKALVGPPEHSFPTAAQARVFFGLPIAGSPLQGGLLCTDVQSAGYPYAYAAAYWLREGRPLRMDADQDHIPCETVYPAEEIAAFLTLGTKLGTRNGILPAPSRARERGEDCTDIHAQGFSYATVLGLWLREPLRSLYDRDGNFLPCDEVYAPSETAAFMDFDGGWESSASAVGPIAVMGIVFEDLNGDGLRQDDEPGALSASVAAYDLLGAIVAQTSTDSRGMFFLSMPPGRYQIAPHVAPPRVATTPTSVEVEVASEDVGGLEYGVSSCAGWKVSKLLNPNPEGDDRFGHAVDVDGDRVVVDTGDGDVYVYTRTPDGWEATQLRVGYGRETARTGRNTVAIQGSTVVVGDPLASIAAYDAGSVSVYELSGQQWTSTRLVAKDLEWGDELGYSVAIDGDRIVAGAPKDSAAANYAGAAYNFQRVESRWDVQRLESPAPEHWNWFGASVAVDGNTIIVAESVAFEDSTSGTVFAFERAGLSWLGTKMASAAKHQLGWSVAADQSVVLIGAPEQRVLESNNQTGVEPGTGYAHLITWTGDGYISRRIDPADGNVHDQYGYDVDLSPDRFIIGAPGTRNGSGVAYVYSLPFDKSNEVTCAAWDSDYWDLFGRSVATDGAIFVIGAPGADDPVQGSGAVYIVEPP